MSFWDDDSGGEVTTNSPTALGSSSISTPAPTHYSQSFGPPSVFSNTTPGASPQSSISRFPPGDNTLLMERLGPEGFSIWMSDHAEIPVSTINSGLGSTNPSRRPRQPATTYEYSGSYSSEDTFKGGSAYKPPSVFSSPSESSGSIYMRPATPAASVVSISSPIGSVSVGGSGASATVSSNGNVSVSTPLGSVSFGGSSSGGGSSSTISGSISTPLGNVYISPNGSVGGSLNIGGLRINGSASSLSSALGGISDLVGGATDKVSSVFGSIFDSNPSDTAAADETNLVRGYLSNEVSQNLIAFPALGTEPSNSAIGKAAARLTAGKIPLNPSNLNRELGYDGVNPPGTTTSGLTSKVLNDLTTIGLTQPENEPNAFTQAHVLQKVLSRGDPILNYEWIAVIVDPANPTVIDPIYIESLSAPSMSFDQKVVFRDGTNYNYAGTKSIGQMTIGLHMDSTGSAMKLASSWVESVYDSPTGTFMTPSNYKKTVKLFVHDAKRGVIACFYFLGVWPINWNPNTWDQSQNNSLLNLSLSVDRMFVVSS